MSISSRFLQVGARCWALAALVFLAACSDSTQDPMEPTVSEFTIPPEFAYTTACSRTDINELIDGFATRRAVRVALKIKINLYIALSRNGPSPAARARLGELIGELLVLAQDVPDPVKRDRIEALVGLLFCILGEEPPALDLNTGVAALLTPSAGATLTLPCETDCTEVGRNLVGVMVPEGALPDGVPFVVLSLVPTTEALPTDLPTRGPTFRISLSPQVALTLPAVMGACLDDTDLAADEELVLARAVGPDDPITPGNERVGALEVARVAATPEEAEVLNLDCLPPAATSLRKTVELLLPTPLHARSAGLLAINCFCTFRGPPAGFWGGAIRPPPPPLPGLAFSPTEAIFTVEAGGPRPPSAIVVIQQIGSQTITGLSVGSIQYAPGASSWLSAVLGNSSPPTILTLEANTTGLAEGTYTANVPIQSTLLGAGRVLSVTLQVNPSPAIPLIALQSGSATFAGLAGEPDPPPVVIAIINGGEGVLDQISVGSPSYGPGATNWLMASVGSSTAPTVLTLTPQLAAVPPGTYSATVAVSAPNAPNSPQIVTIDLTVNAPPPSGLRFRSIASGTGRFVCGITSAGQAYCWGPNLRGQLGDGTTLAKLAPTPVLQPPGVTFTQIAIGSQHTCALTAAGEAYCWGLGNVGQLGYGKIPSPYEVLTPHSVGNSVPYVNIAAANSTSCALDATGQAYCWGANDAGQVGNGSVFVAGQDPSAYLPQSVHQPPGVTFTQLAAFSNSICGLAATGQAYCWGYDNIGLIGDGAIGSRNIPTAVAQPSGVTFVDLDLSTNQACGVTGGGSAYCWGNNVNGSFGTGVAAGSFLTPIPAATSAGPWQTVEVGSQFACGLDTSARVWCWGSPGTLGNGTVGVSYVPVEVSMPPGMRFIAVELGAIAGCALNEADEAYCWGNNSNGSIGDGTTINRYTPVRIE